MNMPDLASAPKSEVLNKLQRLQAGLARTKEKAAEAAQTAVDATLTVAGGAASGLLRVKMPKIPGTSLDSDMAIGAALTAASVFGLFGKDLDRYANCIGTGMLAASTSREVESMLRAQTKAA
jgi:hypothetical protein